jgi:hypothetical protein
MDEHVKVLVGSVREEKRFQLAIETQLPRRAGAATCERLASWAARGRRRANSTRRGYRVNAVCCFDASVKQSWGANLLLRTTGQHSIAAKGAAGICRARRKLNSDFFFVCPTLASNSNPRSYLLACSKSRGRSPRIYSSVDV